MCFLASHFGLLPFNGFSFAEKASSSDKKFAALRWKQYVTFGLPKSPTISPAAKPGASTTGVLRLRVGDLNLECDIIPYAAHSPVILSEPALEGYRDTARWTSADV